MLQFLKIFLIFLMLQSSSFSEDSMEISTVDEDSEKSTQEVSDRSKQLKFEGIKVEGVQTAPLQYTQQQLEDKNSKNRLLRIPANFNQKTEKDLKMQRFYP